MTLLKVKSFSKQQGFGYIDHPDHGELLFDIECCDFIPEEGDEVEVHEVGQRRDGSPKAKRVTCPAKPRRK